MNPALSVMRQFNPQALVGKEDGYCVMIEDASDPDGRMYRIEYRSTADGGRAVAFCLYNPWGRIGMPAAGEEYTVGHVAADGFLCLGEDTTRELDCSPYDLEFTIRRARYWCTAFSVLKETGEFPNPA